MSIRIKARNIMRVIAGRNQLKNALEALQSNLHAEYAASEDLKKHIFGHPEHTAKANVLAAAIRKVEKSLVAVHNSYPGGLEDLYETYHLTTHDIPAKGKAGAPWESLRPLLQDICVNIGAIYAELTFEEKVWSAEFPFTGMMVTKIRGRSGWMGGWFFSNFDKGNPVCRWVRGAEYGGMEPPGGEVGRGVPVIRISTV